MRTTHLRPITRITILCALLALVACSFLVFGSAGTHAATRSATTGSSATTTTVRIIETQQSGAVFSPNAITVSSGTAIRIVNKTTTTIFFHAPATGRLYGLLRGASVNITVTQSEQAVLCSDSKALTITVV